MSSDGRTLRLKVGDTSLEDAGERRARISRHLMDALDLEDRELVRVHGAKPILIAVVASTSEDEGLDIIRLGAAERRNAGVEIGDVVDVERHEIPVATRIRVVLVGHSGSRDLTADDLRPKLAAQPIMAGDSLSVAPKETTFDAQFSILGLNVAEFSGGATECGAQFARVVETVPQGVVLVTDTTEIQVEVGGRDGDPDDGSGE